MTDSEMLGYIRTMGGFTVDEDPDTVLSAYLTEAKDAIMNRAYPFGVPEETDFPAKYEILACKIAIEQLDKRGAEGQLSHSENGISRTYANGYITSDLLQTVVPHCSSIG